MSKPNLRFLILCLLGLAAVGGAITVGPRLFVSASEVPDAEQRLQLQNDVRGTLLQALAGTLFLVTAYFAWGQLRNAQQQLRLSQEGQTTERFTRAVDQLGNSDSLAVRIGGIYGLERIARGSVRDRPAIAEILSAYVRTKMAWPSDQPEASMQLPLLQVRAPDVQAIIRVLGEPDITSWGIRPLEFNDVDLRRAFVDKASFRDGYFEATHLEGSVLDESDFTGAHFRGADLRSTSVLGTVFDGADLAGALLDDAVADRATRWPKNFNPEGHGVKVAEV